MNKRDLVDYVHKNSNDYASRAAAERAVTSVIEAIQNGLKSDGSVSLVGFGTFTVKKRKGRKGRNPQTGESIKIKASKTVGFKPGKTLKESVKRAKV